MRKTGEFMISFSYLREFESFPSDLPQMKWWGGVFVDDYVNKNTNTISGK